MQPGQRNPSARRTGMPRVYPWQRRRCAKNSAARLTSARPWATSAPFWSPTRPIRPIYELNDIRLLREVFIQSYERSAQRYTVIRGAVGEPDPFRVRYRQAIAGQVAEIIRDRCDRREAVARLHRWAEESVIEHDRKRFVAATEETLAGIHEGNFARYRVRPSEFEAWKAAWR